MNRHVQRFFVTLIALMSGACSEDTNRCSGPWCCDPVCQEPQVCYNNTCILPSDYPNLCIPECPVEQTCYHNQCLVLSEHPEICIPKCKGRKVCSNNQCVDISEHPEICIPGCGEGQVCAHNRCVDAGTVCTPDCKDNEICQDGHCIVPDPSACQGILCKDNRTYCDETGNWAACPSDTGCHLGYCIKGLNRECESNTCDADGTRVCKGGIWFDCDEQSECVVSEGSAECQIRDETCISGTCSPQGQYFCNEEGHWESCFEGFVCSDGKCQQGYDEEAAMLWTLCRADSECSTGKCLKSIVTSRPLMRQEKGLTAIMDIIPVSMIDSRIPEDYGICSADCTQTPDVCEQMSTGWVHYSCQIAVIGDSPYPPRDEFLEPHPLPFAHLLHDSDMVTAPFGAICRPDDGLKLAYSEKFCHSCEKSSECGENESCVYGMCLPGCSHNEQCPLGFACSDYGDTGQKFCMPPEQTCGSCIDRDGDGQGYGHCDRTGFDCDDLNPNVSYTGELPSACVENSDDVNCNGMIDQYEFLGTLDHCAGCGDSCRPVEDANIVRVCQMVNPDVPIDMTSIDGLRDTYRYECHQECTVGYADCDGDPLNGCEVRLVDFSDDYLTTTAIHRGVVHAPDADNDSYGRPDARSHVFCCPNDGSGSACYQLPGLSDLPENAVSFNWKPAAVPDAESGFVAITSEDIDRLSDCNDNNGTVYPGAPEICDGLNNDCDPSSADGRDDIYTLNYKDGTSVTSTLGQSCMLYKEQPDNVDTVSCGSGKTACTLMSSAAFGMDCLHDDTSGLTEAEMCEHDWTHQSDEKRVAFCSGICDMSQDSCLDLCRRQYLQSCLCNGIDDNCDGHVDEDWQFETCTLEDRIGICRKGLLTCGQVRETEQETGREVSVSKPVCQPLFYREDGRGYDFYGDGVDSNCDGEDYDKSTTLFVTPYFGTGVFDPKQDLRTGEQQNVAGLGLYYAPYVSLKKALSVACSKTPDGVKCRDILVNSHVGGNTYRDWQTEDLKIPVYNSSDVYVPKFFVHERTLENGTKVTVNTWTHQEIVDEYKRLWKDALKNTENDYEAIIVSADTTKYLLEGEVYPKELVRIIGGMRLQEAVIDGKKVPKWTQSDTPTEYNVNITYGDSDSTYSYNNNHAPVHVLIRPDDSLSATDSMSLYLDSMNFGLTGTLNASSSMKTVINSYAYDGITLIGLSCGFNGCRDLTFHNTLMNVSAPNGLSASLDHLETQENGWKADGLEDIVKASNDIWNAGVKKGYSGEYWQCQYNEAEMNRFVQCYDVNRCLRPNGKTTSDNWNEEYTAWNSYYEKTSSDFKGMCPDGSLPFGGCGGGVCTKDECANLGVYASRGGGKTGWGVGGGAGGSNGTNKGDNCDEGTWCDGKYTGGDGANGAAGKGGKVLKAFKTQVLTTSVPTYKKVSELNGSYSRSLLNEKSPHVYLYTEAYQGNGEYGRSGGGGGGGGVCRAFTRTGPYNSRFIYAGGGGAGGCGGWQGHAGGTGGTAVGLFITPPKRAGESLVITPDAPTSSNRFVFATGGAGGDGQNGQLGIAGADGGDKRGQYDAGHCEVTGGGGRGGTGGSSGGGAAGAPGAAYAFVFACNRKGYSEKDNPFAVLNDATVNPDTPNCGMTFKGSLGESETELSYGQVKTAAFGTDGTDAAATVTGKPGAYGMRGTATGSSRTSITDSGIVYKPNSGVYHYMYIEP